MSFVLVSSWCWWGREDFHARSHTGCWKWEAEGQRWGVSVKKTKQNKTTQDKKKETQTKHFRWGMWGSNASSQDSCPCKSEVQWTVLMHRNGSRCSHTGSSERWVCWKKKKKRPNPETRGTLDHYPVGPFWQATLPLIITGIFRTTPLPLPQMKVISQHAHNQRYRLCFLSLIIHFMNNVLIFSGFRFSNKSIS